jgi:hypothetical protein
MDVFLHVLVVCSRISAKTARRMRKDAELHIKKPYLANQKRKRKSVVPNTNYTVGSSS